MTPFHLFGLPLSAMQLRSGCSPCERRSVPETALQRMSALLDALTGRRTRARGKTYLPPPLTGG